MNQNKTEYINVRGLILNYIRHWKIFVISIICCIIIALCYYKISTPIYQINANVLIQEEENEMGSIPSMMMRNIPFGNLLGGGNTSIYDELQLLNSYSVFREVVKELHLNQTYQNSSFLKPIDYYKNSPIIITPTKNLADTLSTSLAFRVKINEKGQMSVKVKLGYKTIKNVSEIASDSAMVNTNYGNFLICKTPYYQIGKSISVKSLYQGYGYATELLQEKVEIDLVNKKANIVNLLLTEKNKAKGRDILNTIICIYNKKNIIRKNKGAGDISTFLKERTQLISQELAGIEEQIVAYKKDNNISNVEAEAKYIFSERGGFKEKVLVAESQAIVLNMVEDFLASPENEYSLVPLNIGVNEKSVLEGLQKYNEALLERNKLLKSTNSDNPTLSIINEQLSAMRENMLASVRSVKLGFQYMHSNLLKQENELNSHIKNMPIQEREYLNLKRQQMIKQELYVFLLQKEEENALTMSMEMPKAQVVDEAYSLSKPVNLGLFKLMAIGFILGICIAAGFVSWKYGKKENISK